MSVSSPVNRISPHDPLSTHMESWRKVWRLGFAPEISSAGLLALAHAIRTDDPSLTQGCTTTPPPLNLVLDWPVEGSCGLGICGWKGDGLKNVREVEDYFAKLCFKADQRLGGPAECRHFLTWFDDTPRYEMFALLLPEVEAELGRRAAASVLKTPPLSEAFGEAVAELAKGA